MNRIRWNNSQTSNVTDFNQRTYIDSPLYTFLASMSIVSSCQLWSPQIDFTGRLLAQWCSESTTVDYGVASTANRVERVGDGDTWSGDPRLPRRQCHSRQEGDSQVGQWVSSSGSDDGHYGSQRLVVRFWHSFCYNWRLAFDSNPS